MMNNPSVHHAYPTGSAATFTARILKDTAPEHRALEETPFMRAVSERRLPPSHYAAMLLGYERIYRALEDAIATSSATAVRAVWRDDMRKLPMLRRDIEFLYEGRVPELASVIPQAAVLAIDELVRDIKVAAERQPLALLGYLFVTEGSMLGGSALRRHFGEAYALKDDGLRFYSAYSDPFEHWKAFKRQIEATIVTEPAQATVAAGAKAAFRHLRAVFAALL